MLPTISSSYLNYPGDPTAPATTQPNAHTHTHTHTLKYPMCHVQYPMSNPSWELIECRPAHAFLRRIAIFVFWGGGFGADLVCNTLDCPMGCLRRDATQSLMEYQKRSQQQKSCLTSSQESVAFVTLICMIHNIHTILLYTQQQQQKKDLVLAEKLIITYNKQRSFSNQMQLTCCLHAVTILVWCKHSLHSWGGWCRGSGFHSHRTLSVWYSVTVPPASSHSYQANHLGCRNFSGTCWSLPCSTHLHMTVDSLGPHRLQTSLLCVHS